MHKYSACVYLHNYSSKNAFCTISAEDEMDEF